MITTEQKIMHAYNEGKAAGLADRVASPQVTDEQIKDALREIDQLAKNYDQYECGLPLWKEEEEAKCVEIIRALLSAPTAAESRCQYCDDTGDVHDQTGEWRGTCTCKAASQEAKPVAGKVDDIEIAALAIDYSYTYCSSGVGRFEFTRAGLKSFARALLAAAPQQPAPADKDARDAARYRLLRDGGNHDYRLVKHAVSGMQIYQQLDGEQLDRLMDKAMNDHKESWMTKATLQSQQDAAIALQAGEQS